MLAIESGRTERTILSQSLEGALLVQMSYPKEVVDEWEFVFGGWAGNQRMLKEGDVVVTSASSAIARLFEALISYVIRTMYVKVFSEVHRVNEGVTGGQDAVER